MKKIGNTSYKGFTLVELLIILAIIGILGAVALKIYRPFVNRTVCSQVEVTVHEAMLEAVKQLNETGSAPTSDNACASNSSIRVYCPDKVSSITIAYDGNFIVSGTAVDDKCPKGTSYVLYETNTTGNWQ